jgi:hypothetical protein
MGSEKTRVDLHWWLAVAIGHLGEKPVDAAGDVDDMVDALLRERDAIQRAAAQGTRSSRTTLTSAPGAPIRAGAGGLSNSSINKVVRAVRAVLQVAARHGVVERNVALDPETLVRESGPTRSFLEPFQVSALLDAGALLESEHHGLTWYDAHAIRAGSASTSPWRADITSPGNRARKGLPARWTERAGRRKTAQPRRLLGSG